MKKLSAAGIRSKYANTNPVTNKTVEPKPPVLLNGVRGESVLVKRTE